MTPKQLGAVTVRKPMVTSKQTRIEPRRSFTATLVDPTDAHLRNDLAQQRRPRCKRFYSEKARSRPLSAEVDGSARHPLCAAWTFLAAVMDGLLPVTW